MNGRKLVEGCIIRLRLQDWGVGTEFESISAVDVLWHTLPVLVQPSAGLKLPDKETSFGAL